MGLIKTLILLLGGLKELISLILPLFKKSKEERQEEINKAIAEAIETKDPKRVQDIINKL